MSFNVNTTFWSSLIIWDFGTGKTYWVENIVYMAKEKWEDDVCLISNIPNAITDIFYNSPDDLKQILEYLFRFFIESNINIEKYNKTFRDIILVIDEAQLYFPQDWTSLSWDKELLQKLRVILTQCRKRNVKLYLCTQRWKTVNINVRRYTDYIYMYNMQYFFDNPKLKKNTMEVFKCGWGVSDLLGEDWVSWDTVQNLERDRIWKPIFLEYNSFLFQQSYKLKHYKWDLWKEKNLTQHICWLPWNYLDINSYDEFKEKLMYWGLKEDHVIKQIYNQDNLPLFVCDNYLYTTKEERDIQRFISF